MYKPCVPAANHQSVDFSGKIVLHEFISPCRRGCLFLSVFQIFESCYSTAPNKRL
jgi:hypothetical protein